MSMDELAARVGISKPTLYTFFSTKDELIIEAAMIDMRCLLAVVEDEQEEQTPLQRLSLLLQTILRLQIDEATMEPRPWSPEMFKFLCEHEETLNMMDRIDQAIVSLANEAIARGEIAPDFDSAAVVRLFYALTHSLNVGHKSIAGTPDPAIVAEQFAAFFVRGVSQYDLKAARNMETSGTPG